MKREKLLSFRSAICLSAIALVALFQFSADRTWSAERKYPSRSIDLLCGFAAGGQSDLLSRSLAKGLEKYLHTPVVPLNKAGGGGIISAGTLANATPDGYTLGVQGDANLVTAFLLGRSTFKKEDVRVVGEFAFVPNVPAVSADSPWKTIQEFMDYARKNPGLNYAHHGVGSSPYIRVEYFNKMGNLKMKGVPFKGDPEVVIAVEGKHVSIGVLSYQAARYQQDAGKLRILFSFDPVGLGPDPTLPTIPTVFGKDALEIDPISYCLAAPGKTPDDIIKYLEQNLEKVVKDPDFVASLKRLYVGIRFTDSKSVPQLLEKKAAQIIPILKEAGLMK